jgi:hypothetical protein
LWIFCDLGFGRKTALSGEPGRETQEDGRNVIRLLRTRA